MSEQLTLKQRLTHGPHVYGHQRCAAPQRQPVYLTCQHLLAGAVLARYEYVGISGRHLLHHSAETLHGGAVAPYHLSCRRSLTAIGPCRRVPVACRAQGVEELAVVPRLHYEVGGPTLYALHGKFNIGIRRDEHHLGRRTQTLYLPEPVQSLTAIVYATAEVHVKQHHIRTHLTQPRGYAGRIADTRYAVKIVLGEHAHCRKHGAVVIADKQGAFPHHNRHAAAITLV